MALYYSDRPAREQQRQPLLHQPLYSRYVYPQPTYIVYHPAVPMQVPKYAPRARLTEVQQIARDQNQDPRQYGRQEQVPPKQDHEEEVSKQTRQLEQMSLPTLHTEILKSYIKPLDRNNNHEFPLPKELEPYFGKGWTCRYYHSTPAWGFIPPKGSGIRRADGFKALMARYELMDYRRKKSENTKANHSNSAITGAQDVSSPRDGIKSSAVSGNPIRTVQRQEPKITNPNKAAPSHKNPPEPYTAYSIYFRLEHMRLLQENGDIDLNVQSSLKSFFDPTEHPRPGKYKHCILPPYWYSPAHREHVENCMVRLCKGRHVASESLLAAIQNSWCIETSDVNIYCQRLALIGEKSYDGNTSEETTNYQASSKKRRVMSESHVLETIQHQNSTEDKAKTIRLGDMHFSCCSCMERQNRQEELPHQVTLESFNVQEECSSKRILEQMYSFSSECSATSGIGLLAHVASLSDKLDIR